MVSVPHATPSLTHITGYNILQISGFLAISCITMTALFSRRIYRSPNWYMEMFMWMWWCIPYSFLMLSGHQLDVKKLPVPPRALCTIQAALVYASPSSAMFANFGLLAQGYRPSWLKHCIEYKVYQRRYLMSFYTCR
ncbi:hypothetical protein DL96DRAFT_798310 [Flagelloscypha sp. PMI_526]|nr:hypothetical protein DL96DRAFT_798310 [Flagelloscypha sp. PMI_526]